MATAGAQTAQEDMVSGNAPCPLVVRTTPLPLPVELWGTLRRWGRSVETSLIGFSQ